MNNSYFRARAIALEQLVKKSDESTRPLLRNGFVPKEYELEFKDMVKDQLNKHNLIDSELSFKELCSYNTWFAMHPEKIAGEEKATTSIYFPVTVVGTKENIIKTFEKGLGMKKNDISILRLRAKEKAQVLNIKTNSLDGIKYIKKGNTISLEKI